MLRDYYRIDDETIRQVARRWRKGDKGYDAQVHAYYSPRQLLPWLEFERPLRPELVDSLRRRGWSDRNPAIVIVGRDGRVKVGEGNHRIQAALAAGLDQIPVRFQFYQRVPGGHLAGRDSLDGMPARRKPSVVRGARFEGDKVSVHYNLHRCPVGSKPKRDEACFVVRRKGRVAGYVPSIALEAAKFVVQPGGLKRIRKKGSREVIAYATGRGVDPNDPDVRRAIRSGEAVPVCFNPYKHDSFVDCRTQRPIKKARLAYFAGRSAQAWRASERRRRAECCVFDAKRDEPIACYSDERKARQLQRILKKSRTGIYCRVR